MPVRKDKYKYEDEVISILSHSDRPLRTFQICRKLLINKGEPFGKDERDRIHVQVKRILNILIGRKRVLSTSHITRPHSKYSPTPTVYSLIK